MVNSLDVSGSAANPVDTGDAAESDQRQGIQSVELSMRVIEAIEKGRGPLSLSQIAAACGMSASKTHRYLVSLGRMGLVTQSQRAGLYDFGPAMRRVGVESLRRIDEVAIASEFLPALRDRTSHSVNLAVWGDHGPVVVHWEYGAYALPMNVRIGSTLSVLESSAGRVFLSYLPDTTTRSVIEEQLGRDAAATTNAEIQQVRAEVRASGIAVTSGSVMTGLTALSAPVFTDGALPLAVSVALPSRSATESIVNDVTAALRETATAITKALGGHQSND